MRSFAVGLTLFVFSLLVAPLAIAESLGDSVAATPAVTDTAVAYIIADSAFYSINAHGAGTLRHRLIVRINSAKARAEARIELEDSRLNKLLRARGALYDRDGKLVDSLTTLSAFFKVCGFGPQFALYTDICAFNGEFKDIAPPFTVDWESEFEIKTLAFWTGWWPRQDLYLQTGYCEFRHALDDPMRYLPIGNVTTLDSSLTASAVTHRWLITNQPAPDLDRATPWPYRYLSRVLISPRRCRFGGEEFVGDSWQSLAAGYARIIKDAFKSSNAQKSFIEGIQKSGASDLADEVHRTIARRLRYLAIYPELGGWIPHPASETFDNGYGDCKDLSTLYAVLYNRIGFETRLVALATRNSEIVPADFPTLGLFNHVILLLISGTDSVWVDPTCFDCAVGDLPFTDEGLPALVIDPINGALVTTPASTSVDNVMRRWARLMIAPDLTVTASLIVEFRGNLAHHLEAWIGESDPAVAKAKIRTIAGLGRESEIDLASARIVSHDLSRTVVAFNCRLLNAARAVGASRILDLGSLALFSPPELSDLSRRRFPIELGTPRTLQDSIFVDLPTGCDWSSLPDSAALTSAVGSFNLRAQLDNGRLVLTRNLVRPQSVLDTAQFNDFVSFRTTVAQIAKTSGSFGVAPE